MALRTGATSKVMSTVIPQPLIGSWISATNSPLNAKSRVPITVTLGTVSSVGNDATNFFAGGDQVLLIDPSGQNAENCRVQSVAGNTLTLGVQNDDGNFVIRNPHIAGAFGTGTFIALATDVNNVYVTFEDGSTGLWLYLGNQFNMTATFRRFGKLAQTPANTQPVAFNASENFYGAPFRVSEWWVLGTTVNDLYNYSMGIL